MNKCFDYAMKYIYRFPKTEKELRIQLIKKGFSEIDIADALKELKARKYLNDREFTKSYINSEIIKKGKPIWIVKKKLLGKGIDKNIFDELLDKNISDVEDGICNAISKYIEKYKSQGMDGFDIIQKVNGKGYSIKQIKSVIDK